MCPKQLGIALLVLGGCSGQSSSTTPDMRVTSDTTTPTCSDGIQNGTETGVDCGGDYCPKNCPDGNRCNNDYDCQNWFCNQDGQCATPTCSDHEQSGDETDVDCGGNCAGKCSDGAGCQENKDCGSMICFYREDTNPFNSFSVCLPQTCRDSVQSGEESDIDCGDPDCYTPCGTNQQCRDSSNCLNHICAGGLCQAPRCNDDVMNGQETDVDCGGGDCLQCNLGQRCKTDNDCVQGFCYDPYWPYNNKRCRNF